MRSPGLFFALAVVSIVLGVVFYLSAAWSVLGEIRQGIAAKPYLSSYKATVVGFNTHHGRHSTTAPIIEVESPDETKFRFTSSRYSIIQTLVLHERVELVLVPGKNALGEPAEQIEIAGAYHLWLGHLLYLILYPSILAGAFIVARFFPSNPRGKYILPP